MAHSFAEQPPLQCPECGTSFTPEIWPILDAAERPDLIDRAADGTLHHVTCPNSHPSAVDAPLVIFRRAEARPVILAAAADNPGRGRSGGQRAHQPARRQPG